jgi:hypothetical protein
MRRQTLSCTLSVCSSPCEILPRAALRLPWADFFQAIGLKTKMPVVWRARIVKTTLLFFCDVSAILQWLFYADSQFW